MLKKIGLASLTLGALLLFSGGLFFFFTVKDLPNPELIENRQIAQSTKIYDRTGEILLYEIHGEEKRTIIPFEEIPDIVKQATIAIEDAGFYKHPAFDWKSLLRALITNLLRGKIAQGGSTITQQLAKNAFLSPERTFTRKIKELILALQLEKKYTKDEILNLYLNQIPYGANAYGIEAAAQTYFKKSARNLNLAEAVLLAALPKAPSYYSPWGSHQDELMARRDYILDKMQELGFIDEQQNRAAKKYQLTFAKQAIGIKAPHFVIAVQEYLNNTYGEDFVRTAGLKVITTLDWKLQELAERVVAEGAKRNEELYQGTNAALVVQDASTGQILAMVGSRDYFDEKIDGKFNVAVQGLRQPGSAIKPFVYLAAFKKGFTPETVLFDLETEFDTTGDPEKSYKPQNFDERFRGPVTLKEALAQSINVPAVKTLYLAGIDNVLKLLKDFGVTTLNERSRYGLSLVLGGGEVKLAELVGAYSVLAQEGIKHKQTLILKISDASGKILEEYKDEARQVFDPEPIRVINNILSDSQARAPLFANSLNLTVFPDQEVALKTGTTNDYRDAWAFGYTKSFVVGVWAGNNDNTPMQKRGSSILAAIPIWHAFLSEALKEKPVETFAKSEPNLVEKPVLQGKYIVNYKADNQDYPQIHEILFYVDKNDPQGPEPKNPESDPQFSNWEEPVIKWAKENIPNFDSLYNQPLPENAIAVTDAQNQWNGIVIDWRSPINGSFLTGNQINLEAKINSGSDINKIEVWFNNQLANLYQANFGKDYLLKTNLTFSNIQLQNLLKLIIWNSANQKTEKEIILFK